MQMNKLIQFLCSFLLLCSLQSALGQQNRNQLIYSNEQADHIFYHTIERGQTVYAIATMYGVSTEEIYRLNPDSKTVIKAGEMLRIPQPNKQSQVTQSVKREEYLYHTIEPQETLYGVSTRYKVPATDIVAANPGLSTATFTIGKIIRIPAIKTEDVATQTPVEMVLVDKIIEHTIQPRETMHGLTRRYGVTSEQLISLNPRLKKEGLKVGMVLRVPTKEKVPLGGDDPVALNENEVNALLNDVKEMAFVDHVQVVLLLPFMSNEATVSSEAARCIEYYEGLLLAVDKLKKEGCPVILSVYDTGKGTERIKELLKEKNMQSAHLIIGAVQNEQIKLVADFANKHNIKYVIPFTSKNDDVLTNSNVFQVNTPHSYLYSIAAQAACDLFLNDNVVLVKTPTSEEKTDYIQALKTEMQQRNIAYREMTYMQDSFTYDLEAVLDSTRRNVVIPTSSSLEALNSIKTPLRQHAEYQQENKTLYNITLFGYPEWQTYLRDCLEDLYALNAYIYTNFYADNLSVEVKNFYDLYKQWYSKNLINIFPKYGILGYDTGLFFIGAIRQCGIHFEDHLDKVRHKSIQTGFNFERVNNWSGFINTNIFIVQYNNNNTVTKSAVR